MKKVLVLTGVVVLLTAVNFDQIDSVAGLIVGMCWLIATACFYKKALALIFGFLKWIMDVCCKVWDFFMYRL